MIGLLYLVGTPIGNLQDLSFRALEILKTVSWIACEDKRVSQVLTRTYGISTPLISYHEYNAAPMRPKIMDALGRGESGALISDAGMPLISDPGYKLVEACLAKGMQVVAVPGASAVLTALCVSGLPSDRFFFQGFLPLKEGARVKILESLSVLQATLIFFEAPHRIHETLKLLLQVLGNRRASLSRELTKKFEESRRGKLEDILISCTETPPRGEITLVVEGAHEKAVLSDDALKELILETLQILPFKETVSAVTQEAGLARNVVYKKVLELKEKK